MVNEPEGSNKPPYLLAIGIGGTAKVVRVVIISQTQRIRICPVALTVVTENVGGAVSKILTGSPYATLKALGSKSFRLTIPAGVLRLVCNSCTQ